MITKAEILMGRDKEFPLTPELERNLNVLWERVNYVGSFYGKVIILSSGYRPGHYNKDAGGAKVSPHITCEAIDCKDPKGELAKFIMENKGVLLSANLYMEHPDYTKGWVHLQTRAPKSGKRIFIPY